MWSIRRLNLWTCKLFNAWNPFERSSKRVQCIKHFQTNVNCRFLARDVIYTSRTYAAMSVSVCLWRLCIVVTGCNGSRIPLHAWIDGSRISGPCLCYLLTTLHPDRQMGWCRDFWWKRGVMEKLVIVAISLILLTESPDQKHVTVLFI